MKTDNRILIFDPKPNATADEVMEIMKLSMFQTYPPELRTRENMLDIFDNLSDKAKRHFKAHNLETPA
jgi:hypothetical protein